VFSSGVVSVLNNEKCILHTEHRLTNSGTSKYITSVNSLYCTSSVKWLLCTLSFWHGSFEVTSVKLPVSMKSKFSSLT
jgi:hypothetical protein